MNFDKDCSDPGTVLPDSFWNDAVSVRVTNKSGIETLPIQDVLDEFETLDAFSVLGREEHKRLELKDGPWISVMISFNGPVRREGINPVVIRSSRVRFPIGL